MDKTILVLADGTELCGGGPGDAVVSLTHRSAVNSGQELTIGSACSDSIEAELWCDPGGSLRITEGDVITCYRQSPGGARTKVGVFRAEKPTRTKRSTYKITAYDGMSRLDADFSAWLYAHQSSFPLSLTAVVNQALALAGVSLASGAALPDNGSYPVQAFYSDGLTCRQIVSWATEAAACYAHMDADGKLVFARPASGSTAIAPQKETCAVGYFSDSLSYEDYTVAAIQKVQIRQSDSDIGVIWPDDAAALNTYAVQGNLLLTTGTEDSLKPVAQAIYNALKGITYTPCSAEIPAGSGIAPGQLVQVRDVRGRTFQTLVMSAQTTGGRTTLESTGSPRRDSSGAVNHQTWKNLQGRMLEISAGVDGLNVKASELAGSYSELKQTVDGLSVEVSNGSESSRIALKSGSAEISAANIQMSGVATFRSLKNAGECIIDGGNVTTGIVKNAAGTTEYNLDNGTIRMGGSSGNRVYIDSDKIEWYGGNASGGGTGAGTIRNGLTTGTSGDTCVIGADTRYQKIGWYHGGNFQGITVEQVDNEVMVSGKLSVNQAVSCRTLKAWDAKERVVRTPLGNLQMNAMESPEPLFWDVGSGVCDSTGVCWIALRPEYAETISRRTALRWVVTPTGGPGSLWVEKLDTGAMVHGGAGQRFDWACAGVQRGFEGCYAEGDPGRYPVPENPGDWLLTAAIDEAAVDLPLTI